jgi:hypothetical protein
MFTFGTRGHYWASLVVSGAGVVAANTHLSTFTMLTCSSVDPTPYLFAFCFRELSASENNWIDFVNAFLFFQPVLAIIMSPSNILRMFLMAIYVTLALFVHPLGSEPSQYDSFSGVVLGWGLILLFGTSNIAFIIYWLYRIWVHAAEIVHLWRNGTPSPTR